MTFVSIGKVNPHLDTQVMTTSNILIESIQDSEGELDMNVDGSVTPVLFEIGPESDEYWMVTKFSILLTDMGVFTDRSFGALPILENGVEIQTQEIGNFNLKSNIDLYTTGDAKFLDKLGSEVTIIGKWSFSGYGGVRNTTQLGIRIDSKIGFLIQDDLRGLVTFRSSIEGMRFQKPI